MIQPFYSTSTGTVSIMVVLLWDETIFSGGLLETGKWRKE